MNWLLTGAMVAGLLIAPAASPATWTVEAPGGGPAATVRLDEHGSPSVSVSRDGATVLDPSPLGLTTEQADLTTGLSLTGRSSRIVVEKYATTAGKRLKRMSVMKESRFRLTRGDSRLDLVVRAARDGVAYRYELPGAGAVVGEASAFAVPGGSTAWLAGHRRDYENPFIRYADVPAAEYQMPALFRAGRDYLLLAESALDGSYTGPRLVHDQSTYKIALWDARVPYTGGLVTPWRVMITGDLATVTESTLVDDLAPGSRIADPSWVRPGKVLWSWLAGGRPVQQSLERQKEFVDYAAQHGWPYVLVDAGWYDDPVTGERAWTDRTAEFTWIPQLVDYGRARGVGVMTWLRFSDFDSPDERVQRFGLLRQWGVKGVKLDFIDSEAQERLRWYDETLRDLADNRLMVNFHGSTVPKGINRTWPHVMTMEGVHGAEKSSNLTTSHLAALPYTRNQIGSMDYTPMAFQRGSRPTSDAHELALSVLFESGLQNLAGSLDAYRARPEAERFLDQVPAIWDETRLLSGTPAEHTVMARRSGDRWFIGAGVSGAARTLQVPAGFLRGRWLVEVTVDGAGGLVRQAHVVRGGPLAVQVAAEGGFAAIACRWRPGLTTCAR
ncbi:alpha-glucosidase [Nonomuraea solani]|uniref:Alpha-glucosidase n=1 Tax=Nonomuraea solani TaxID=1144553 RepID=A0A1H6EE86_9ACTN|nr:glycoside hydrolase family 97 protein [Nonomuraea solani]SEG95319.1 alpha-glucosidase [Nonomuraea solani]